MTQSTPPPDQGWSDRPATTTDATEAPPAPSAWPAASTGGTVVAPVARPGLVTAAGVVLIVLGVLTLVIGVFGIIGAAAFAGVAGSLGETADAPAGFGNMMGAFAGLVVVVVILVLAWGVLQIVAGAKSLSGRNWARITGIVVGVIGALLFLAGLTNPDAGNGIFVNIAIAAAYVFVVIALAMGGSWFRARSA
jgi:hypothetical protein